MLIINYYKLISIVLTKKVSGDILRQIGKIKEFNHPQVVYFAPREEITAITSKILETLPVTDLNIEEPSIEDIIRELFTKKNYL